MAWIGWRRDEEKRDRIIMVEEKSAGEFTKGKRLFMLSEKEQKTSTRLGREYTEI